MMNKETIKNYWDENKEAIIEKAIVGGYILACVGTVSYCIYSGGRTKGQVEMAMAWLDHTDDMKKAYDRARIIDNTIGNARDVMKWEKWGDKIYRNVMRNFKIYG